MKFDKIPEFKNAKFGIFYMYVVLDLTNRSTYYVHQFLAYHCSRCRERCLPASHQITKHTTHRPPLDPRGVDLPLNLPPGRKVFMPRDGD